MPAENKSNGSNEHKVKGANAASPEVTDALKLK
jgi:hypothetical protein